MNDEHDNRLDDNAIKAAHDTAWSAATEYAENMAPTPSQRRRRLQLRKAFLAGIAWKENNGDGQ